MNFSFNQRWGNPHRRLFFALFLAIAASVLLQPVVRAQTAVTGSINGLVVDLTGAVVPDAAVTVKDQQTGAVVNLTSNADGRFVASFLKPDKFEVTASALGFQTATASIQVLST